MMRLFKKRPAQAPETSVLPHEVAVTIESAHVLVRSGQDENGNPRVLVTIPGRRFYGNAESIAAAVSERWPELNPSQQRRACAWFGSLVASRLNAEQQTARGPRWKDWRPDQDEFGSFQV